MKNFQQFSLVSRTPICFSSGLTEFKISSNSSSLKMSGISPLARRSFLGKYWVIGLFRPIRILSGNFRLISHFRPIGHVRLIRTLSGNVFVWATFGLLPSFGHLGRLGNFRLIAHFRAIGSFGQLSAYCTLSANWVVWVTLGLLHTFGQLGQLGNFRLIAHFRPIGSFGQLSAYCTLSANWVVWATFGVLHTFGQLGHLGIISRDFVQNTVRKI